MLSCEFTPAGAYVVILLNASTDMGKLGTSFKCSYLFNFQGSPDSTCIWRENAKVVHVYASSAYPLKIRQRLDMRPYTLRAACSSNPTATEAECALWPTSPAHSCYIRAPSNPVAPVVTINAPTVIGECDNFSLDLASSSGSGGRVWHSISVTTFSLSMSVRSLMNISDINHFYRKIYSISPPTPLPGAYLKVNETYGFNVTLCNFMGKCTLSTHYVRKSSKILPIVSIVGSSAMTTRNIYRRYPLHLTSTAYVRRCGSAPSTSGLTFSWRIYNSSNTLLSSLKNTAHDVSNFKLSPFSLHVGELYSVTLRVVYTRSGYAATSSVKVFVLPSNVAAVISGGDVRFMAIDGRVSIDGSASYDEDIPQLTGKAAGLTFSWSCSSALDINEVCDLYFITSTTSVVVQLAAKATAVLSSESFVTLRVYDGHGRMDVASTRVVLLPAASASVSILESPSRVRHDQKVTIKAAVTLPTAAVAQWKINDPAINLSAAALTSVTQLLAPGQHFLNLVVNRKALYVGSKFTFTLSVSGSGPKADVYVVAPPSSGVFTTSPSEGKELRDFFHFSTSRWYAESADLPLTYKFGYIPSNGEGYAVIKLRSELSYVSSALPAGPSLSGYKVTTIVVAYNILDAERMLQYDVVVKPVLSDSTEVVGAIGMLLNMSSGNIEETKRAVSLGISVLNIVNCSLAPNCSRIHRFECALVPHTCGPCFDGYVGSEGSSNSHCQGIHAMAKDSGACQSTLDCPAYHTCASGQCQLTSKSCNNCSGHGECQFVEVATGNIVGACPADDVSCDAMCQCNSGFYGDICEMTTDDLQKRRLSRYELIAALNLTFDSDDISDAAINDMAFSLSLLGLDALELSVKSCDLLVAMSSALLTIANSKKISYEVVEQIYSVIDTCAIVMYSSAKESDFAGSGRRLIEDSGTEALSELLASYLGIVQSNLVAGQSDVGYLKELHRTVSSCQSFSSGDITSVFIPHTNEEDALNIPKSFVDISLLRSKNATDSIPSDAELSLHAVESLAKLYHNGSKFLSNPVHLAVTFNSMGFSGKAIVTFVLQNHRKADFNYSRVHSDEVLGNTTFTSVCDFESYQSYHYTCPVSGINITHHCDGRVATLSSTCPPLTIVPVCYLVVDKVAIVSSDACQVVEFTPFNTTCECIVSFGDSNSSRRLTSMESIYGLELTTIPAPSYVGELMTVRVSKEAPYDHPKNIATVVSMFATL